jgi:hypothetical protein
VALPVPPSDDTRRRLLLAKALYQVGAADAMAPLRSYRRIMAMVSLDLANETLLKAVCWSLGEGDPAEKRFPALLEQARTLVAQESGVSSPPAPPLPGQAGAVEVHAERNRAQHRSRSPSEEDLAAARMHTREFQVGVARQVWAVEFDALAASDMIEEPTCRARMIEAEAAVQGRDYLGAARAARSALVRAAMLATAEHRFHIWSRYRSSDTEPGLSEFSRDAEREFSDIREDVRQLSLGLDRVSEARLARWTGYHSRTMGGEDWDDPEEQIDQAGAEWALAYCTGAIVQIEERFGTLSEDRW